MKRHYAYNITNILIAKSYIGVRSCDIIPIDDLGYKYFSSSQDKEFIQEQKEYPERFLYNIIEEFSTREQAMDYEIELHALFNVYKNEDFYNRANAITTGFISDNTGTVPAFNIKENSMGRWPKEDFDNNRDNYIFHTEGMVTAFNIEEDRVGNWPKEEYDNNRENYIFINNGMVTAFNIKENKMGHWSKEDFDNNRENFICANEGMVTAFNIKENSMGRWPKEDFDNNRDNYIISIGELIPVFNIKEDCMSQCTKEEFYKNRDNYLHPNSNEYKLFLDSKFVALPTGNKNYQLCYDRDTLGRIFFLKTDSKNRDKNRFPSATNHGKKQMLIRNKRKLIPKEQLPVTVVWSQNY